MKLIGIMAYILIITVIALLFSYTIYQKNRNIDGLVNSLSERGRQLDELKQYKDNLFYWRGSSAFILRNGKMKKVLNINELIKLKANDYR